jgi:hypothetical protein
MLYELIAAMVRKSKRLNVVQSRAQYANGDFANSEQSRSSRELLETLELEDNENMWTTTNGVNLSTIGNPKKEG